MLSIPLKTTNKVDLLQPLQQFIVRSFSKEQLKQHEEALNHLHQLREDVRTVTDKSEHTRDVFCRYYGLLETVEKRFPINEENIKINFVWFDCLKRKKIAQYSIHYEKACVLFNIAAISSQIAEVQNRTTPEGLKKASHFFQLAAGTFEQLRSYLEEHPQQAVPVDFSADYLNMAINLMLAQAQECFCEKAAKDNISPMVMAMLTAQAADYYDLARALMIAASLSSYVDAVWPQYAQVKSAYFKASANHSTATVLHSKDQYGDEVARLQMAANILASGDLYWPLRAVATEVQDWFNRFKEVVAKAKSTAEKENDTIYHERVPSQEQLAKLPQKAMVKSLPPGDLTLKSDKDPFSSLVPFHILQSASVYNEKKAGLVREELKQIREHSDFAKGSLSSMNLPASIEGSGDKDPLPPSLREKSRTVRQEGGPEGIEELVTTLNKLADEARISLDKAFQVLDEEEEDDKQVRAQQMGRWNRPPSHALTAGLRQEGAKLRSNLEHAQKSDSFVLQKFDTHRPGMEGLAMTEAELQSVMPAVEELPPEAEEPVEALKESLGYLDSCIAQRNALEVQLKQTSENDDVTGLLLTTPYPHEVIFAQELRKYEPIQAKIKDNLAEQGRLLETISNENTRFVTIKSRSEQSRRRLDLLAQMDKAYEAFVELRGNLREGIEFYSNFDDVVSSFRTKCKDFVFARGQEKKDLLTQLQSSASRPVQSSPSHNYPTAPAPAAYPTAQLQQPTFGYPQPQIAPGLVRPPGAGDYGPMPGAWQPHMTPVYQVSPQQPAAYQQPPAYQQGYSAPQQRQQDLPPYSSATYGYRQ